MRRSFADYASDGHTSRDIGENMNWVVTVDSKFKYWVEAPTKEDAEARGFRLHCASENFNGAKRSAVTGCIEVS